MQKIELTKKSDHRTICDSGFIFGFTVFAVSQKLRSDRNTSRFILMENL